MISLNDVSARLRLLRYGLIVVVVTTFLISLLAPTFLLRSAPEAPPLTDFLGTALLFTVGVAVLCVVVYFVYKMILERTVGGGGTNSASS